MFFFLASSSTITRISEKLRSCLFLSNSAPCSFWRLFQTLHCTKELPGYKMLCLVIKHLNTSRWFIDAEKLQHCWDWRATLEVWRGLAEPAFSKYIIRWVGREHDAALNKWRRWREEGEDAGKDKAREGPCGRIIRGSAGGSAASWSRNVLRTRDIGYCVARWGRPKETRRFIVIMGFTG